ncbi:MAG TPA: DUF4118 domain-containing protein [Verrucomicrobia bacterium]|nr:DUF4118 domain-containing protein [Verrucomicrobiota bacterium]HOB32577.1 ATP-binding protein [Verrucomicrobiota bacterium]HOP97345.1 ATP-binding protein [Verrucomicrobiota bacterium]HPU54776.1 ATP-binding protein [Verrucomicrobiota bacterium]
MPGPAIYGAENSREAGVFLRGALKRCGVAVLCALAAAAIRRLLDPVLDDRVPWLFFFPAVLLSAWYGRFSAGALTAFLAILIAAFNWMPSVFTFSASSVQQWTSIAGFLASALLISWTAEIFHRARRDLDFERRFLNTVLSSLTDGLVVLDSQWRFVYLNDAAAALTRLSREQLIGRVIWELFPRLKDSEFEHGIARSRAEKMPVHFEMAYPENNLWFEFRVHPMNGSTAIYITDISRRKRTERDLAEARDELAQHASNLEQVVRERTSALRSTVAKLEESVAELERFSYTISHDLRAPLRAMHSFATFIAEDYGDRLDAQAMDYLGRIQNAARRMDALINDVLIYTRTSRAEAKLTEVDLDKLVEAIIAQYTPAAAERIRVHHPLGSVRGNEALLTQAISNLLVNAVKFVRPGEPPDVTVWSEPVNGSIRLFVRDKGIGIPEQARGKLFGIFERAHGNTYAGTGVGLAIVKRAMERMNGKLGFTSEEGKGSTFWIELPEAGEVGREDDRHEVGVADRDRLL